MRRGAARLGAARTDAVAGAFITSPEGGDVEFILTTSAEPGSCASEGAPVWRRGRTEDREGYRAGKSENRADKAV